MLLAGVARTPQSAIIVAQQAESKQAGRYYSLIQEPYSVLSVCLAYIKQCRTRPTFFLGMFPQIFASQFSNAPPAIDVSGRAAHMAGPGRPPGSLPFTAGPVAPLPRPSRNNCKCQMNISIEPWQPRQFPHSVMALTAAATTRWGQNWRLGTGFGVSSQKMQ